MPRFSFVVTSHANTMPPRDFRKDIVHKEATAENFAKGMAVQHVLQKYRREKRRVASAELVRQSTRLSRTDKVAAAAPPTQPTQPQAAPLISGLSVPGLTGTGRSTVAQAAISVASQPNATRPSLFDCVTIPVLVHYDDSESSSSSGLSSSEVSSDSDNEITENSPPPDETPAASPPRDSGVLSRLAQLFGSSVASVQPDAQPGAQKTLDAFLYDNTSRPPQDSLALQNRPV